MSQKTKKQRPQNVTALASGQRPKLGADAFAKLGLSESAREKLAAVGRLFTLASEPKAIAFIRLSSGSMLPKETAPSAKLDPASS